MSRRKKLAPAKQRLQIIAGSHRHRQIDFIAVDDLRPTGARIRETLFNWLQAHLPDATCLDLFAGSGILGLEALSRGAKSVIFVEKDRRAASQLTDNIAHLQLQQRATVKNADFRDVLPELGEKIDVIFLDPPYALRLLPALLDRIKPYQSSFVFIEDDQPFEDWVGTRGDYQVLKAKKAGNIYYGLLRPIVE